MCSCSCVCVCACVCVCRIVIVRMSVHCTATATIPNCTITVHCIGLIKFDSHILSHLLTGYEKKNVVHRMVFAPRPHSIQFNPIHSDPIHPSMYSFKHSFIHSVICSFSSFIHSSIRTKSAHVCVFTYGFVE